MAQPVAVLRKRKNGRGGQIRTDDLYVPNVALYQAKLRPDNGHLRSNGSEMHGTSRLLLKGKIFSDPDDSDNFWERQKHARGGVAALVDR